MFNKVLLSTISFLALASAPFSYSDDSHVRIVRVSYAEGTVELNNQKVTLNVPLIEGNVLSTGVNSLAEVEFEDGSTLRLAPDTQVTFSQLARLGSGEVLTTVDLDGGEVEFNIKNPLAGQFNVSARRKTIQISKSGRFRVLSTNADPLELAVWKGEATVHDFETGQDVVVEKEETFALAADDPLQYDLEKGVEGDALDTFSEMRDEELVRDYVAANSGQTSAATAFSGSGFLNPCGPYYWYPGIPQDCFSPLGYYQPYPYVVYEPGYYYHHRHHHHIPHIHPPAPPATATASVPGLHSRAKGPSIDVGKVDPGKRPVRVFDDETFKRSVPLEQERETKSSGNTNQRAVHASNGDPEPPRHPRSGNSESAQYPVVGTYSNRSDSSSSHSGPASAYSPASRSPGSIPHSSGTSSVSGSPAHSAGSSSASGSAAHSSGSSSFSASASHSGASSFSGGSSHASAPSASSSSSSSSSGSARGPK